MSLIKDFNLDIPARKYILLALDAFDENSRKKTDIIHINKIIKLSKELADEKNIEFSNYNLGAVSYEVNQNVGLLEEYGLLRELDDATYILTKDGELAVNELKEFVTNVEIEKIEYSKKLLNDMNYNELLYYMYKLYPDTIENSTQYNKLDSMKKGLIKSLLKKNKIDIKTANEWLSNILKKKYVWETKEDTLVTKEEVNSYKKILTTIQKSNNGLQFITLFEEIFSKVETIAINYTDNKYEIDMAIWIDELENIFGNPILIEYKIGNLTNKIINMTTKQLLQTMIINNIKTGIILYIDKEDANLYFFNDNYNNILYINAHNFIDKLQNNNIKNVLLQYSNES